MRFVADPSFARQLDRELDRYFARRAADALTQARAIGGGLGGTGRYAESLEVDGRRLLTTDFAGHLIEWGSVNNPPYAPLRRAVEATGARFQDDGRAS